MPDDQKDFFTHAIQMVEVESNPYIPTVLLYKSEGAPLIGSAAVAESSDLQPLNEDFKIDLGWHSPTKKSRGKYLTANGNHRTAMQLADEFIYELLKITKLWLAARGIEECRHIVVAEPLSMHAEEVPPEWLTNYREALRRILEGKVMLSSTGMQVDFIPEPFAVFQYYRHGIRHPQVFRRTKMNALVIDFGGGTCDVCVIETTKEGDISYGGRNKRPIAAGSIPIGGFHINRAIAEHLVRSVFQRESAQIKSGIRFYKEWRQDGDSSLEKYDSKYRYFILNFHSLVHRVENLKLALCRRVSDWSPESQQRLSAQIGMPNDIFAANTNFLSAGFSLGELQEIFFQQIYKPSLRPFILKKLETAHQVLDGEPITTVLLSGGSANIGWLAHLLTTDLAEYIDNAPVIRIPDFQEVVAKGLAVECARRFACETGDFSCVTYNPLNLLLDPDSSGREPRPFKKRTSELPDVHNTPGLLLPTASIMAAFIEKPLRWRIRLSRAPKRQLDYFFLRSTLNPEDLPHLQNLEEHTVFTPDTPSFDSHLQVQLTVREDGTAIPKFIYKSGQSEEQEIGKEGKKFYLDMTSPQANVSDTYLGLDFGTSNSAVSYINRTWVQLVENRASEPKWQDLDHLVDLLPYPISTALARYIGSIATIATPPEFSFLEAALTLTSYVAFCDYCLLPSQGSRLFKDFRQRSAGPLWQFLRNIMSHLGQRATFSKPLHLLFKGRNVELIDSLVNSWKEVKHEKSAPGNIDALGAIRVLANLSYDLFRSWEFGYFQDVQKTIGGEHKGRFRISHGKPPFSRFYLYCGPEGFSDNEAFIVNAKAGEAVSLTPLAFWYACGSHRDLDMGHCFFYDKYEATGSTSTVGFKASDYPCHMELQSEHPELGIVSGMVSKWREKDPTLSRHSNLKFLEGEVQYSVTG